MRVLGSGESGVKRVRKQGAWGQKEQVVVSKESILGSREHRILGISAYMDTLGTVVIELFRHKINMNTKEKHIIQNILKDWMIFWHTLCVLLAFQEGANTFKSKDVNRMGWCI